MAFSNRTATRLFQSSSNSGQNILQWTIWNTSKGSRTAIGCDYYSMLFAKFNDGLCSLPNIWMQLDLIRHHGIVFTGGMISTNLVHWRDNLRTGKDLLQIAYFKVGHSNRFGKPFTFHLLHLSPYLLQSTLPLVRSRAMDQEEIDVRQSELL